MPLHGRYEIEHYFPPFLFYSFCIFFTPSVEHFSPNLSTACFTFKPLRNISLFCFSLFLLLLSCSLNVSISSITLLHPPRFYVRFHNASFCNIIILLRNQIILKEVSVFLVPIFGAILIFFVGFGRWFAKKKVRSVN